MLFAFFDTKKDLWPQSWNIMNILTRNPEAKTESNSVKRYEYSRLRYIRYHINTYGITELHICHILLFRSGRLYFIITLSQDLSDSWRAVLLMLLFIIVMYLLIYVPEYYPDTSAQRYLRIISNTNKSDYNPGFGINQTDNWQMLITMGGWHSPLTGLNGFFEF
jgi:hypothetical protein